LKNEVSGLGDERPLEPPAVNRLAEIQVPTLVIVGDLDRPEIIEAADLLQLRIPRARRAVIPDTAHLPNMERPQGFNRVALGFLEGL
jgi:pimeloyl-ACP methyl ester carboxylesterase